MWTIFKVFIEFVTILLLFYVLVFWMQGKWDLSSLTRDRTAPLALEDEVLTTELPGKSLTSLIIFIPGYFILCDAIVNVFLLSLSNSSFLVYKNATDFCVLILYSAPLPNTLMSSSCLLVAF